MTLQERIKNELKNSIMNKDDELKNTLRIIIGEFSRQANKELPDYEVIPILKKLAKSERETLTLKGETNSRYLEIIETYLPKEISREKIVEWIRENINFGEYKNKMQSMRTIMNHFGDLADGNKIKAILNEEF